jgi:general secretion pathway protein N
MTTPETQVSKSFAAGRFITQSVRAATKPQAVGGRPRNAAAATASWGWAVAGVLLGLCLGVALFAPARWLASAIATASGERVLLQQAQGSVWNGSARLTLAAGEGSRDAQMLPGRVHWQLRPSWSGARLALTADCCAPAPVDVALALGWGRVEATLGGAPSRWPAELLSGLGTPMNTLAPTGTLALSFQAFRIQRVQGAWRFDGGAQLDASELSSRLSTLKPLGSYRLQFNGGEVVGVNLSTVSGALQLSGAGQWVGGRLRFRGEAQASTEHEAALANLINIMTRRENGRAVINIG